MSARRDCLNQFPSPTHKKVLCDNIPFLRDHVEMEKHQTGKILFGASPFLFISSANRGVYLWFTASISSIGFKGKAIVNLLPFPNSVSTVIVPPCN